VALGLVLLRTARVVEKAEEKGVWIPWFGRRCRRGSGEEESGRLVVVRRRCMVVDGTRRAAMVMVLGGVAALVLRVGGGGCFVVLLVVGGRLSKVPRLQDADGEGVVCVGGRQGRLISSVRGTRFHCQAA
jgi:hypothetical protein